MLFPAAVAALVMAQARLTAYQNVDVAKNLCRSRHVVVLAEVAVEVEEYSFVWPLAIRDAR